MLSCRLNFRRGFMQETLNRMVASVRHGVLGPEDASRSIHECAALLGFELATEIPVSTIIISGMRKTVTAADIIDSFCEFGDISEAAVASNQRGFGTLRCVALRYVGKRMVLISLQLLASVSILPCLLNRAFFICLLGILRFKTGQAVDRALQKYRVAEIVVQDVGVQIRVLRAGASFSGAGDGQTSAPAVLT